MDHEHMFEGLAHTSPDGKIEEFLADIDKAFLPEVSQEPYTIPEIDFAFFQEHAGAVRRCVKIVRHFLERPIIPYTFSTHEEWIAWRKEMERKYDSEERFEPYLRRIGENKLRANALTAFANSIDALDFIFISSSHEHMRDLARYIEYEFAIQEVENRVRACQTAPLESVIQEMQFFNKKALQFLQELSRISTMKEPKELLLISRAAGRRVGTEALEKMVHHEKEFFSHDEVKSIAHEIQEELERLFDAVPSDRLTSRIVTGVIFRQISGGKLQELREEAAKKLGEALEEIPEDQLEEAWRPLWRAVFRALQEGLRRDIKLFLESHAIAPGVIALHDGYIHKRPFGEKKRASSLELPQEKDQKQKQKQENDQGTVPLVRDRPAPEPEPEDFVLDPSLLETTADREERHRQEALRALFSFPERSSNLAYHVLYVERRKGKELGEEIQHRIPITPLDEILQNRLGEFSYVRALRIVCDAMRGAQFLIQHDLRLTDLSLQNIAYHEEKQCGMLFDYDALRKKDEIISAYLGRKKEGYIPPEHLYTLSNIHPVKLESVLFIQGSISGNSDRLQMMRKPHTDYDRLQTIQESDMVFELGVSLRKCLEAYPGQHSETAEEIRGIVEDMTNQNYHRRPELRDAIARLDELLLGHHR